MRDDEAAGAPEDLDIEFAWEARPTSPPAKVRSPHRRRNMLAAALAATLVGAAVFTIAAASGTGRKSTPIQIAAGTRPTKAARGSALSSSSSSIVLPGVGSASGTTTGAPSVAAAPGTNGYPSATVSVTTINALTTGTRTSAAEPTSAGPAGQNTNRPAQPAPVITTSAPFVRSNYNYLPGIWSQCAVQNATCPVSGQKVVAYGDGGRFAFGTYSSPTDCSPGVFGNPGATPPIQCYTAAPPLTPGSLWTQCAIEISQENSQCTFSGVMTVAFGADGHYNYWVLGGGGTPCAYKVLGDPDPGHQKTCYIMAAPPTFVGWHSCGSDGETCGFADRTLEVAWGANGHYSYGFFTNQTVCSNAVFGDPDPGVTKLCYVQY